MFFHATIRRYPTQVASAMANIVFPPTPASSIPSPADGSTHTDHFEKHTKMYPQPGPSKHASTMSQLPPTPPADDPSDLQHLSLYDNHASSSQRVRPGRRAASASPAGEEEVIAFPPPRKLTDPHPRARSEGVYQHHQDSSNGSRQPLDVDLDGYSAYGDSREPTLSFVTTLTNDSTTGTPSLGHHKRDGEGSSGEPRIRTRSTVGRSTAYSSAESSGAYSYHAYENQVFHPHPPPLPKTPQPHHDQVGLGIGNTHPSELASSSSNSFGHLPWQSDVATRQRSDSAASSSSRVSQSSQDYSSSLRHYEYHYNDALPWEIQQAQDNEPEAVAMVEEGRERTMDMGKLQELGGLSDLTDDKISALSGITHLLLSRCGTDLVRVLPSLLAVLAPTLVVLDISHNAFTALPDELRQCLSLEELNVSSNPLRSVPPFIGGLFNLRQVQLDQCTLQSLPAEMQNLSSLHTLCLRRNRLVSLPAWLSQLDSLEMLKVDENPFAREWVSIVAPILARSDSSNAAPAPYIPPRTSSYQRPEVRTAISSASLASSISSAQSVKDYPVSPAMQSDLASPAISATPSTVHLDAIAEDDAPHSAPLGTPQQYVEALPQPRMKRMKSAGNLFESRFQSSPVLRATRADSDGGLMRSAQSPTEPSPDAAAPTTGKTGKSWGFLRKMSMNRLRSSDKTATLSNSAASNVKLMPPALAHTASEPVQTLGRPSLRSAMSAMTLPNRNGSTVDIGEFGQLQAKLGPSATVPLNGLPSASGIFGGIDRSKTPSRGKRRSFLPIDTPPSITLAIPSTSPLMPATVNFDGQGHSAPPSDNGISELSHRSTIAESSVADPEAEARYSAGLESIKSYLRDLFDLGRPEIEPYSGFEVVGSASNPQTPNSQAQPDSPTTMSSAGRVSAADTRHTVHSDVSVTDSAGSANGEKNGPRSCVKKVKDDKAKRAKVLREIYETERTYVRGLGELVTIYVRPSGQAVTPGKQPFETVVPSGERKIVFGGIESILTIHRDNLLPALERAIRDLIETGDDEDGTKSKNVSHAVGEVFRTYIAYMKQYSTYINNFDNAMSRMKTWTTSTSGPPGSSSGLGGSLRSSGGSGPSSGIASATIGASLSAVSLPVAETVPHTGSSMTTAQRKRVKAFLKRCRAHPMHSQINLESYLLLPIQRVPRYKLLLEDLAMCTPFRDDGKRDTLDDALREISGLASLMNEEKREADSRLRLYHWQKRIASKGPSPLVQPHRKLILDGTLILIRLVKKAANYVEVDNSVVTDGESTIMPSKIVVPVEHIVPEPLDKPMVLILCSDMLVLAQQRTPEYDDGKIDLFNVLRLSTVKAPASVVNATTLRVVDNRSIYYFHAETDADALKWCRAINSARKR